MVISLNLRDPRTLPGTGLVLRDPKGTSKTSDIGLGSRGPSVQNWVPFHKKKSCRKGGGWRSKRISKGKTKEEITAKAGLHKI